MSEKPAGMPEDQSKKVLTLKQFIANTPLVEKPEKVVSNYIPEEYIDDKGKTKVTKHAKEAKAIWKNLTDFVGDKIKRVKSRIFVNGNDKIKFIESPDALVGWAAANGVHFEWTQNDSSVSKSEFVKYIGNVAEEYDFASTMPHFPPVAGFYYIQKITPAQTGRLEELILKFNPNTSVDMDILRAAFCTPFWGGRFGCRPAFLIDGLDGDSGSNRGIGKTAVTDAVSLLCGGHVDISNKTEGPELRKLILTADDIRIVRMDNIKSNNLSNEALESLITSQHISGHQMYLGHNSIPNWFTYFLTFNDAVLSKDMAQRAMIIRLKRPTYQSNWWEDVVTYIEANRRDIVADIGFLLLQAPKEIAPKTRFPHWEKSVLGNCTNDLSGIQTAIEKEQAAVDDDVHVKTELMNFIYEKLMSFDHFRKLPEKTSVGIHRRQVYDWCCEYFGKTYSKRSVIKKLEKCMPHPLLSEPKKVDGSFYLVWVGDRFDPELLRARLDSSFVPSSCYRLFIDGHKMDSKTWNIEK